MRIIIIAFDALDRIIVGKGNWYTLQQQVYGRTGLEGYIEGGGNPDYLTDEIFASFITGTIPDVHGVKIPIELDFTLKGKMKTIFDLCDFVAVDVPSWNRHPDQHLFQVRVPSSLTGKKQRNLMIDTTRYFWAKKWDRVVEGLREERKLTMVYFWFTDILGHIFKGGGHLHNMYNMVTYAFNTIRTIGGDEPLYMIMSDHGMFEGNHRPEGAFWSLSKPLLGAETVPQIEDWFEIIEGWLGGE